MYMCLNRLSYNNFITLVKLFLLYTVKIACVAQAPILKLEFNTVLFDISLNIN